jgi:hypothetical protein
MMLILPFSAMGCKPVTASKYRTQRRSFRPHPLQNLLQFSFDVKGLYSTSRAFWPSRGDLVSTEEAESAVGRVSPQAIDHTHQKLDPLEVLPRHSCRRMRVTQCRSGPPPSTDFKTLILRSKFRWPWGPDRRRSGPRGERIRTALPRASGAFRCGPTLAPLHIRSARESKALARLAVFEREAAPAVGGTLGVAEVAALLLADDLAPDDRGATKSGVRAACS